MMIVGDVNVHRSRLRQHVEQGDVWVRDTHNGERCDLADPKTTCLKPLERCHPCMMDLGHSGRCSSVTFYCDSCGLRRRGQPYRTAYDPDGVPDAHFCFMCCGRGRYYR